MKIVIHRGSSEIGGTCIQLSTENTNILVDIGLPLSPESNDIKIENFKPDAVIISHSHQDHYGLIDKITPDIPVYIGKLGLELIESARIFLNMEKLKNNFKHFEAWESFDIGDFTITPYLVDHSATDAYAFLIEADGKKIFYSGDFRAHGRKAILYDKFIHKTPKEVKNVDVMFLEGTMLGRQNEEFSSESEIEYKILEILSNYNKDVCFLICSSQNVDRLVSAFKAAKKSGRIFVVDIYTAWVMEKVADSPKTKSFPNINWDQIKVLARGSSASYHYGKVKENADYFKRFAQKIYKDENVITEDEIADNPGKYIIKNNQVDRIVDNTGLKNASLIYSMWNGYMEEKHNPDGYLKLKNWQTKYNWFYAHASGHAFLEDLQKFASAIDPKKIIPIHTEFSHEFKDHFENVHELKDNIVFELKDIN